VRRAALAAALALAAVTAARLPAVWQSGNALNHVSGVWLGLADDLARGTLYRPLHAGETFGGTRYFPLVFVLEAGLVRAGLPAVTAGEVVSLAAGLLLALGLARLLRAAGARRAEALAGAALAFAGLAGQRALANARGDLLPVALSALALAAIARGAPGRAGGRIAGAAALLVLAFAAKPTALSAAAAAVLALALRGRRRAAAALAALVAAGALAVVAATDALSGGRFLVTLRASAVEGLSPRTALAAPVRLVTEAAREDPAGLALALLAVAALAAAAPGLVRAVRRGAGDPRLVPALWVTAAWVAAAGVYAAPGTGVNHLLELQAASAALLVASALAAPARRVAAVRAACTVAACAGLLAALGAWRADRTTSRLAELRAVVAALPPGPVVSEDPLVPLLAGTSPVLLDPFFIRGAPRLARLLAAELRGGDFAAVVLLADLDDPGAEAWYARGNLGLPLADAVRAGYRRAGGFGRYHLYVPRGVPVSAERADAGVVPRGAAR
jgi:hypothetical protein